MGPYRSLCVLMGRNGFLCVYMESNASLWVLMRLHGSLCVFIGFNASLWVFKCPYWSLASLCVPMGPNGSL